MTELFKGPQAEDFLKSIYVRRAAQTIGTDAQAALDELLASCESTVDSRVAHTFHKWRALNRMFQLLTRGTDESDGPIARTYRVGKDSVGEDSGGEG